MCTVYEYRTARYIETHKLLISNLSSVSYTQSLASEGLIMSYYGEIQHDMYYQMVNMKIMHFGIALIIK